MQNNSLQYFILMSTLGIILLFSCEKEEIVEKIVEIPGDTVQVSPKLNYTDIRTFTIVGGQEDKQLKASIRKDSIYIYWPAYWELPDSIAPQITLAEKATVSPSSGSPVPFETGTSFTVTAEDSSTKKYILKQVVNQTQPWFKINHEARPGEKHVAIVHGDFFIPDTALTSFYLISLDDTTKEYKLDVTSLSERVIWVDIPSDLEVGLYEPKLVSGWRMTNEINGEKVVVPFEPSPSITWDSNVTVAKGGTFTIPGENFQAIDSVEVLGSDYITLYDLDLVEYTSSEITVKVPSALPYTGVGKAIYIYHPYISKSGFYGQYLGDGQLTITEN